MRRKIAGLTFAVALVVAPVAARGAPNPSGTGQPSQQCGSPSATQEPPGFGTGGFSNAEGRYAGSQPQNSNNGSSVSQYDVACYQKTNGGSH